MEDVAEAEPQTARQSPALQWPARPRYDGVMNAERRPDLGANRDQREASNSGASHSPGAIELLGLERLEEHARRLAALLTVSWRPRGGSRVHLKRLRQHTAALRQAYT